MYDDQKAQWSFNKYIKNINYRDRPYLLEQLNKMEYDRALYNVYEKTMEDLMSSRRRTSGTLVSRDNNRINSNNGHDTPDNEVVLTAPRMENTRHYGRNNENHVPFLFSFSSSSHSSRYRRNNTRSFIWNAIFNRNSNRFSRVTSHDQDDVRGENHGELNTNEVEMNQLDSSIISSNSSGSPVSHSSSGLRRRTTTSLSPRRLLLNDSSSLDIPTNITLSDDEEEIALHRSFEGGERTSSQESMSSVTPPSLTSTATTSSAATELARNIAIAQLGRAATGGTTTPTNATQRSSNSDANNINDEDNRVHRDSASSTPFVHNNPFLIFVMRAAFVGAMIHFCILAILHFHYVGQRISKSFPGDPYPMTCLERALLTRQQVNNKNEMILTESISMGINAFNIIDMTTAQNNDLKVERAPTLLGSNELLQVKIIYDKEDCVGKCSRVRYVNTLPAKSSTTKQTNVTGDIIDYDSLAYWETPHYRFSKEEALLKLDDALLSWYNISIINVTLTESCLTSGKDGVPNTKLQNLAHKLSQFYDFNPVIINQFMYGIKNQRGLSYSDGFVENMMTNLQLSYSKVSLHFHHLKSTSFGYKIAVKLLILLQSFICYICVTSVTALVVRILTSSGILTLYPILALFRCFGVIVDEQVLEYSHPWIGVARRQIERRGLHRMSQFVSAHIFRLILIYGMYEACQSSWNTLLYNASSSTIDLPLMIFSMALVTEYTSLIYVRSALR